MAVKADCLVSSMKMSPGRLPLKAHQVHRRAGQKGVSTAYFSRTIISSRRYSPGPADAARNIVMSSKSPKPASSRTSSRSLNHASTGDPSSSVSLPVVNMTSIAVVPSLSTHHEDDGSRCRVIVDRHAGAADPKYRHIAPANRRRAAARPRRIITRPGWCHQHSLVGDAACDPHRAAVPVGWNGAVHLFFA